MSPADRPSAGPGGAAAWVPLAGLALLGLLGMVNRGGTPVPAIGDRSEARAAAAHGRAEPPGHARTQGGTGTRQGDSAPGEPKKGGTDVMAGVRAYLVGLGLAALLTAGSFFLSYTHLVYGPALFMALIVFAIAQIGIHLVFFLHLTTSPDNINNAMALAFGVLILGLLIGGTLWIMAHMNANMMPMNGMTMPGMTPGSNMNMAP